MACRTLRCGAQRSVGWTYRGLIQHLDLDDEWYWFCGTAAGGADRVPGGRRPWMGLLGPEVAAGDVFGLYRQEIAWASSSLRPRRWTRWRAAGIRVGLPVLGLRRASR
jgi:hypothetical protein